MLLKQLDYEKNSPTLIYIDKFSALQMINDNTSPTEKERHINIHYFVIQDWKLDGSIIMVHIKGILNPSDDLMKPLGYILHSCRCHQITSHYDG